MGDRLGIHGAVDHFFAGKTRTEAGREELRHPALVLDHVIDLVYLITNLPAWPNG